MEYNDGHVYTEYTLGYKTGNFQTVHITTLLLTSVCFFVYPAEKI
jgi:hypothetical protein